MPASLGLLDVAGNGSECERFLWIRGLSDRQLPPRARIDLVDELQHAPGELLHAASIDGSLAATTTITPGDGVCELAIFSRIDPGEPLLGDVVQLAIERARAGGARVLRCSDGIDRPHIVALQARHGFVEHERWRRFHVDVARSAVDAPALPDGLAASTLAARGDLAAAAFRARGESTDTSAESWLRDIDGSPVRDRGLVLVLHAGNEVHAVVELARLAMDSNHAEVTLHTTTADLDSAALQQAVALAARSGLRRLLTAHHAELLGWTEDTVRVTLTRDV